MITKKERRKYWEDLDTGELVTYYRMCIILVTEYDFEEYITPESEIFEFFNVTDLELETDEELAQLRADYDEFNQLEY